MTQRSVIIVDGNSWMHRAFHAISTPLTAPDGRPTNAVFGFFSILNKAIDTLKPDAVVVAFDAGKPKFRIEALEQYKVHRPPTDPDLKVQFPMVEDLLMSLNVPVVKLEHWEGDDILGTLSLQAEQNGMRTYLATGDRDAYQLVTPSTSVVTTKVGAGSEIIIIGPDQVTERYGIHPDQVIDYLGLKGDPSDNIPGVSGIGEKTASKLLQEYQTLESVIEAAKRGDIKGRAGANLVEHEGAALASRTVATIMRDVPVELDLSAVTFGDFDVAKVQDAFGALRLRAPLEKLLAHSLCNAEAAGTPTVVIMTQPTEAIGATWVETADTLFDLEQTLVTNQGTPESTHQYAGDDAIAALRGLLSGTQRVACLDTRALIEKAYPSDSAEPIVIDLDDMDFSHIVDVSLIAYLLESARADFSIETLANDYLGTVVYPAHEGESDDAIKARMLAHIADAMLKALEADESTQVYRDIDLPLIPVLVRMERYGIKLDTDFLAQLQKEGAEIIESLRKEIHDLAGREFTIDSPKQLAEVLFEDLGLPPKKKKKTGFSTDASVLAELAPLHPIAEKLMNYREYTKLQSTYIESLPRLVGADGRLHTTFKQTVAATGRLSSINPNLQNIPVRTELGRRVRRAFIPGFEGWKLISADYSQIELRVLAHLSEDEGLIEAFTSGRDFHAATAARIFEVAPDAVDPRMRSRAKAVNFGIVYGQGARALGLSLGIGIKEAQAMIDRYYEAYPRVKSYLDETIEQAARTGWALTAFGRKRRIPELKSAAFQVREFGKRTAMNHPMQGTAADLIKLAMIEVDKRLVNDDFESRMLLQVHDELLLECPEHEIARVSEMVREAMSGVAEFKVPLDVSVAVGATWEDAK